MDPLESTASTSILKHHARCAGANRSWVHGGAPRPRASTSILRAGCRGINRPWVHCRTPHPRASTSVLRAPQEESAHAQMGQHPIHEHPRAPCALHRRESLAGPWGITRPTCASCAPHRRQEALMGTWESTPSTSIYEDPARCANRNRSWAQGRAPRPLASTIILCPARVGAADGPIGEHRIHEHT